MEAKPGGQGAALLKQAGELDAELGGAPPIVKSDAASMSELGNAVPVGGDPPPAAPAAVPLEVEIAGLFVAVGVGLGQFFPSVPAVLTEPKCGELGAALAPVLRKYGLEKYFLAFAWRVELQAALVVIPTAVALKAAIMADLAAKAAAAATAAAGGARSPAPPSAPSTGPITETRRHDGVLTPIK